MRRKSCARMSRVPGIYMPFGLCQTDKNNTEERRKEERLHKGHVDLVDVPDVLRDGAEERHGDARDDACVLEGKARGDGRMVTVGAWRC